MKSRSLFAGLLIIQAILISSCGGASNRLDYAEGSKAETGKAVIVFNALEHDFGAIQEGEKVACIFTFENKGSSELVITRASTSCGCTIPKYDSQPIRPGEKGSLEVVFNSSGYNGIQTKTISVHSNASTPVMVLRIIAEVKNNL
jgi:hypothetical protein